MASMLKKLTIGFGLATGVVAAWYYQDQIKNGVSNTAVGAVRHVRENWWGPKQFQPAARPTPQQAADYFIYVLCARNAQNHRLIDSNGTPDFLKPEHGDLIARIRKAIINYESIEITENDAALYFPNGITPEKQGIIDKRIINFIYLHPEASRADAMCAVVATLVNEDRGRKLLAAGSRQHPIHVTAMDIETAIRYRKFTMNEDQAALYARSALDGNTTARSLGIFNYFVCRQNIRDYAVAACSGQTVPMPRP